MQINIPENLSAQLEKKAGEQGYDNTENYIINLLEQLVQAMSSQKSGGSDEPDDEKVKERLRQLGYLE